MVLSNGNCEEQNPSTDSSPTVSQLLVNSFIFVLQKRYLPVDLLLADSWLIVGKVRSFTVGNFRAI